jgi:hypothetical protein
MTDCTAVDETSIKLLKGGAICIGGSADGVQAILEAMMFVLMVSIFVLKKS